MAMDNLEAELSDIIPLSDCNSHVISCHQSNDYKTNTEESHIGTHRESDIQHRAKVNTEKTAEIQKSVANEPPPLAEAIDSGWSWVVLVGAFFGLILIDGIFWSFGVFFVAWQDQISGSITELQWITSLLVGLAHITGPLGSALCRFASIRQVVIIGAILCSVSFIIASFSSKAWHLYATFSCAGIGFGLMYQPSLVILTYYFDKRLARANGVAQTGTGLGLFIIPPLLQFLIDRYGWQGALLIVAGVVANNAACAALYRPSTLELQTRSATQASGSTNLISLIRTGVHSLDLHLLRNLWCNFLFLANLLYVVAYTSVIYFLAAKAVHDGISEFRAAFLVSLIGINSVIARLTHGYIVDYHLMTGTMLTAICCLINAVCCVLNPLYNNYIYLAILSSVFGLSSGVANALVIITAKEYAGMQHVSGAIGIILLVAGVAAVVGSYITGVLFDSTKSYDLPFFIAGACFFVSSVLFFVDPPLKRIEIKRASRISEDKSQNTDF